MLPLETRSLLTRLASQLYGSDLDAAWEMYIKRIEETGALPHTADFMFFLLDQGQISQTQYHQLNQALSEKPVVLDSTSLLEITQAENMPPDILIQIQKQDQTPTDPKLLNQDQPLSFMDIIADQAQLSDKQPLSSADSKSFNLLEPPGQNTSKEAVIDRPDSLWKKTLRALAVIVSKFY